MANQRSKDHHAFPTLRDSLRTNPEHAIDWDGHQAAAEVIPRILAGQDPEYVLTFCPQPQQEATQGNFLSLVDQANPPPEVNILLIEPTIAELNALDQEEQGRRYYEELRLLALADW